MMQRVGAEALEHAREFDFVGRRQEQHVPTECFQCARNDGLVVAAGADLVGKCAQPVVVIALVPSFQFSKRRQPVFLDRIKLPDFLRLVKRTHGRRPLVAAVGGVDGMPHVRATPGLGPIDKAVMGPPQKIVIPRIVKTACRVRR